MTWVKISTTDFSAQSSVSIEGAFSATYSHYLIVRNLLHSAGNQNLLVRLRVGGADDSGTNYRRQYISAGSTSVSGQRDTGQTSWVPGLGEMESAAFGWAQLRISNPFEAVRTTAWIDNSGAASGNITIQRTVMAHDLETSYTGLTVFPQTSGTITGSISCYGLKAS